MISFYGDKFESEHSALNESADADTISYLKEHGVKSSEGESKISEWLDKKEKELEMSGSKYYKIEFFISAAEFYFKLGLTQEVGIFMEDAWGLLKNAEDHTSSELLNPYHRFTTLEEKVLL